MNNLYETKARNASVDELLSEADTAEDLGRDELLVLVKHLAQRLNVSQDADDQIEALERELNECRERVDNLEITNGNLYALISDLEASQ